MSCPTNSTKSTMQAELTFPESYTAAIVWRRWRRQTPRSSLPLIPGIRVPQTQGTRVPQTQETRVPQTHRHQAGSVGLMLSSHCLARRFSLLSHTDLVFTQPANICTARHPAFLAQCIPDQVLFASLCLLVHELQ